MTARSGPAWLAASALAAAGCLDFAPPPAPVGADAVTPSCDEGVRTRCALGTRCLDVGEQDPALATCQLCGPDGAMIACPFACDDGRCASVVDVQAGHAHACVSLDTGAVWCWGARDAGAVGDGVLAVDDTPPVASAWPGPTDALAVGLDHTCVLGDGEVYCWGGNSFGQAGRPPSPAEPTPGRVDLPGPAVALARTHGSAPCAVLGDGTVWCWGFTIDGSSFLAGGAGDGSATPTRVDGIGGPGLLVATGTDSACAYDDGGGLRCWGAGEQGALGTGSYDSYPAPEPIPGLAEVALTALDVGDGTACAIDDAGAAWCWGANAAGQTGRPETEGDAVLTPERLAEPPREALDDVALGFRHACARGVSDRVFCWGLRVQGQAGAGFLTPSHVASPVGGLPATAGVATGGAFSCALGRDDGLVWCWGSDTRGQLGVKGLVAPNTALPVVVGTTVERP